ncbi:MAG TPA: pyrroloquinoline quinone biosynthesis protein PqqB [Candidatus Methylomirabilis sp.]|nr:pyrroloquinoline quinone biosynthesis protein PqqB [Candidatus Methylomirabilis sp.]
MLIRVLGSAAGGGFPQWNCGCPNCRGVREGTVAASPRTQESVAVSADGDDWFLLNVSPDVHRQIEAFPRLHPRGSRHSPIRGILLNNGDLDHCLGLLLLREFYPLAIYATDQVRRGFTEDNVLYHTLERFPGQATWHGLKLGREEELLGDGGRPSGLSVEAVPAPGKLPVHLEKRAAADPEQNVGFRIRDHRRGGTLAYFPAVGRVTAEVRQALDGADCAFLDGTFWSDDELPALKLVDKRAEDMAHLPVSGETGSLAVLAGLSAPRRILIHINNTNPLLREDSPQRRAVAAAGWEVAHDGMEIAL